MTRAFAVAAAFAMLLSAGGPAHADELDPGSGASETTTPIATPPGVYLVTDVYAGSVATTTGASTRYSTITVHAVPGTYAKLLAVVGTGAASAYDGRAFNGRGRLSDGRQIAGAYYQTYVLTPAGFVPVNIVFFQDDSETRALVAPTPTVSLPSPSPSFPSAPPATPLPRRSVAPSHTMPPLPVAAAGIALASDGPILSSIDVLRARSVELWPRAFVGGAPVPVRAWRLISASAADVSRTAGTGTEPAIASWTYPSVDPLVVRFEVIEAVYGRTIVASLTVTVRSPALTK